MSNRDVDRPFRYEAKWIHHEKFSEAFLDYWNKAKVMGG